MNKEKLSAYSAGTFLDAEYHRQTFSRISGIRSFTDFRKNDKILLKARTELPLKVNHISATIMRKSTLFDMKVYRDNVLIHLGAILLKLLVSIFGILCNQNPSLYDYAGK